MTKYLITVDVNIGPGELAEVIGEYLYINYPGHKSVIVEGKPDE